MANNYKALGERVKVARFSAGMKQETAAAAAGITQPTISRWERGGVDPSSEDLAAFAKVTGVAVDWLLTGNGQAPVSEVGEAVRKARVARKMSQQQLADHVGTSQQTIFRIEAGTIEFSRTLPAIAAALEVDLPMPEWLSPESRPASNGAKHGTSPQDVLACLTAYVREHGKREGLLDALLPPERQEEGIARAMGLIEYLSREDSADAG